MCCSPPGASARPGKAYGLDMTDEMLALARENQQKSGLTNVEFLKGEIEHIPLPDNSVDVIISNCVINLSADKDRVIAEAFRVLKPGGRFAVSDVVVRGDDVPEPIRRSMELWVGCVAGALEEGSYREQARARGIRERRHRADAHLSRGRREAVSRRGGTLGRGDAGGDRRPFHERIRPRAETGGRKGVLCVDLLCLTRSVRLQADWRVVSAFRRTAGPASRNYGSVRLKPDTTGRRARTPRLAGRRTPPHGARRPFR